MCIQPLLEAQEQMQARFGKPKLQTTSLTLVSAAKATALYHLRGPLREIFSNTTMASLARNAAITAARDRTLAGVQLQFGFMQLEDLHSIISGERTKFGGCGFFVCLNPSFNAEVERSVHGDVVSETGHRCDGRKFSELRPMSFECSPLPGLHGSSLVSLGDSQVSPLVFFRVTSRGMLNSSNWHAVADSCRCGHR